MGPGSPSQCPLLTAMGDSRVPHLAPVSVAAAPRAAAPAKMVFKLNLECEHKLPDEANSLVLL